MILSGSLLPRLGPRVCAMGGGLVFGAGWLLASLGRTHFIYTTIGIKHATFEFNLIWWCRIFSLHVTKKGFEIVQGRYHDRHRFRF